MEKIKHFIESDKGKDIMIVIILILVGLASFGLGRLSKNTQKEGIKIEYRDQEGNILKGVESTKLIPKVNNIASTVDGKAFFASNRGTKYYPLGCNAGKNIKMENRIYFNSAEEAEKSGYSISTSC